MSWGNLFVNSSKLVWPNTELNMDCTNGSDIADARLAGTGRNTCVQYHTDVSNK